MPSQDKHKLPYIGKCIYSHSEKTKIAQRVIDIFISSRKGRIDEQYMVNLAYALLRIGPFFKNHSFSNEQEWRVVFEHIHSGPANFGKPLFRVARNLIVPYMDLSFLKYAEDGTETPERI